ncbi:hypothetical protein J1G44_06195 [Cellulomonas sp. zg-ZUI199]|uniref:Uncharacterized protein n=1 Tax=Cellulomonas wangleii TaxID=2816956 RepID=A0ABX8D3Q4_9CELL|nr:MULTISPECIES: hypothetical protein [Cellulomonas]MBO0898926.1 hypothetical protein [Cellulomonas sp. zg-ZUI22]MBO0923787.1 hypothetical protein [Cellulomonas wangleii]MBO0924069.1 hypothetical protein [Cellulomonas wangleii]QVI62094.1 hypothetical protein KG103_17040 [Cellulomonas wangleii]
MTALLVHPSRGKGDGQLNAGRSLLEPVPLDSAVAQLLTADERLHLQRRHGDAARFWGTYRHNLKKYERVTEGDPVLFTGGGGIWATARIGFQFRNKRFAEELWHSHPEKGVYEYVYSVTDYARADIAYAAINAELGLKPTNHFQAMASYEGAKAETVIAALGL